MRKFFDVLISESVVFVAFAAMVVTLIFWKG